MRTRLSVTASSRHSGCGAAVATSSMATELVKGKTIYEALQITNKAVMEALDGLPSCKGTLFSSRRGGNSCGTLGLRREA